MTATMRLEVFVADLERFTDFYTRVLGFTVADDRRATEHPYVSVAIGDAVVGASVAWSAVDPRQRRVPQGVEIVIESDDVAAEFERVERSGWPVAEALQRRPWGLTDFRVYDTDGHYIRVTSRPAGPAKGDAGQLPETPPHRANAG